MRKPWRLYKPWILNGFIAFLLASCNTVKFLPEGEKYLDKSSVKMKSRVPVKGEGDLQSELESLQNPQPNKKLLGARFNVWAYHRGHNKEKPNFIGKWIKKKFGEEPVYLSKSDSLKTMELINNRLENRGFFYSDIRSETRAGRYSSSIEYKVELPQPYILDSLIVEADSASIEKQIVRSMRGTSLKQGKRFDLEELKAERERIDERLKNQGYYYFNPDYLLFKIDTNKGNHTYNLYLSLKAGIPKQEIIPYRINSVTVFPDYSVKDTAVFNEDTIYDGIRFRQKEMYFLPKRLKNYILFVPGNTYSRRRENLTSSRLGSIGNYRYVNIRFTRVDSTIDSSGYGRLNSLIYLSPLNKRTLRAELQALSKSNNFAGPSLLLSYRNRNLFRGGESLNLTGKFSYEAQIAGGRQTGLSSYEAGIQGELVMPRLIGFTRQSQRFSYAVPRTMIRSGFSILNRVGFYRLNSTQFSLGMATNTSRMISHEVHFPAITYAGLSRTTPAFDTILINNPFLRRSFEQQFIVGLTYDFQYNQLVQKRKKTRFLLIGRLDNAGNLVRLLSNNSNQRLFGEPYARYVRVDGDIRMYLRTGKESQAVLRIFAGAGRPFGNSLSLPFIKQYFSGGPNSIRAFRIRSLGPGTYRPPELDVASYFDQAGDIKFEANAEYRFPLVSVLKGALFADAGNVWLFNENPALPGGKFSKNWVNELAVGTGLGFRVDVEFIVVRLDIATPLRKPYLDPDKRWVDDFRFGYKSWRKENLIWNIAIGYPF